jgi:hypothetical protein
MSIALQDVGLNRFAVGSRARGGPGSVGGSPILLLR